MNFKKRVNGSWVDTPHYIHNTSTDTITTLPAVIYPTGTTATVGLKGQTTQSSIPSPTSPVMPQGTGERAAQLFNKSAAANGKWLNVNTGLEENTSNTYWLSEYIPVKSGTMYSFSDPKSRRRWYYDSSKTPVNALGDSPYTPSSDGYIRFTITNEVVDEFMLNTGSTALPYEPYGYKIPILSADTTTPVYLGEVESTRRIKKLVLTGEETFDYANSCFTYTFDGKPTSVQPIKAVIFSNAYEGIEPKYRDQLRNYQCCITRNYNQIAIRDNNYTDTTDFKSYLAQQYAAGTPVTVWYILAEPTTGIVNEPLRKIGDYADTVSGISIPTIAGANTLSVDTTLQPSEVTATYKGWHPVQSVHEYDSNYTIATMQALTIAQLQTHTISELQGGEWS